MKEKDKQNKSDDSVDLSSNENSSSCHSHSFNEIEKDKEGVEKCHDHLKAKINYIIDVVDLEDLDNVPVEVIN